MEPDTVNCPQCDTRLHLPPYRKRIVCPRCGADCEVPNLERPADSGPIEHTGDAHPEDAIRGRLVDLDESIDSIQAEIEELKSRELGIPLQLGCSFFALFTAAIIVIAVFMLLGRGYFGSGIFYLCLGLILLIGVLRMRNSLKNRAAPAALRRERADLEQNLKQLRRERQRIENLLAKLTGDDSHPH